MNRQRFVVFGLGRPLQVALLGLAWSCFAGVAYSQENAEAQQEAPPTPQLKTVPTTQPTTRPLTPEQKRLAELLAVKYDRKPPAVLEAMSPKPPATQPVLEPQRLKADVESGNWVGVKAVLKTLPEADARKVHANIVQQLNQDWQAAVLSEDALELVAAFPGDPGDEEVTTLGTLLGRPMSRNYSPGPVVVRLEGGVGRFGGKDQVCRTRAAALLFAAGRTVDGGVFLPSLDEALANKNYRIIDMHARYQSALAETQRGRDVEISLRKAWDLTQVILGEPKSKSNARERDAAFERSLGLMPRVSKELGDAFLRQSFKDRPADGFALLTQLATQVAQSAPMPGRQGRSDYGSRLTLLQLQRRAADGLLQGVGEDKREAWGTPLSLLALNWLTEADWTAQRFVQRESYSRRYYPGGGYSYDDGGMMSQMNPNEPQPIPPQQLIESAPSEGWLKLIEPGLQPRIAGAIAAMHLKADNLEEALPLIERVASRHPRLAQSLAGEFLRGWARVRNPNRPAYDPYASYYYGQYGSSGGQGIALTRLSQERNLKELGDILQRLKKLSIGPMDDSTIVNAFSSAHSQAEVFVLKDIEAVFGPAEAIPEATFLELGQTMRQRLAREWRQQQPQQQAKTRRTDKDVDAEVVRGYQLILSLLDKRQAKSGQDWRWHLMRGTVFFDWAEFEYGKKVPLAIYTKKRDAGFEAFAKSVQTYTAALPGMEEREQTAQPFQQYFSAALGSSDLQYLTRQDEPDKSHVEKIREALFSLPEPLRERHVSMFGRGLMDGSSSVPAELKARYLRVGVRIVGDHASVAEARKTVEYYQDLMSEAELHVGLDMANNDSTIGHKRAFGVFISLRHTNALGRESGGFAKYLTNPSSSRYGYYQNYPGAGTPRNYRDDFEKKIRQGLVESFEIISITFHDEKVESRGYGRPDWRETPLAYVLLKAKDAKTDRIPPIQLDLEFSDKRGPVILPIASNMVLVDARPEATPPRPLEKLAITQVLDSRDAAKGKLTLEVKATANGLIPDLVDLFDTNLPGLKATKTDEQPVAITKLDTESERLAAVTERSWLINYDIEQQAADKLVFRFPSARIQGAEQSFKRYADADLENVSAELALAGIRLHPFRWWPWAVAGGGIVAFLSAVVWWRRVRRHRKDAVGTPAYSMPHVVTPFTVIDLLRRLHGDQALGISPDQREQLLLDIQGLERNHFAPSGNGHGEKEKAEANLPEREASEIARQWLVRLS